MTPDLDPFALRDTLPPGMLAARRWLLHDGRKIPHYVDGTPRNGALDSPTDTDRLASLDDALHALGGGQFAGIGFALGAGWQGIDLDKHRDPESGELTTLATHIVDECGSYTEVSPSGTGVHIIGCGETFAAIGAAKTEHRIEAYAGARYFTVTGRALRHAGETSDIRPVVERLRARFVNGGRKEQAAHADADMGAGRRNDFLASEAGKLRRIGCTAEVIAAALHVLNAKRCKPPLEPDEVEAIAKSVGRYDEAPESTPPVDILRTLTAPRLRTADVPEVLARFAEAQARATGFDESILLAAGVAAAGAALSDDVRLCVAPSSSWFESPRLWVAIVGGSGSGKSPGIKAMLSPIFAMHREGIAAWQSSHKGDDDAPPAPKLYVNDATVEALADVLAADSRGLLYSTDELTAWLGAHDAYRNGAGKDRGEWLRLYDGGPHQVERVSRGSTFVRNWGVSLLSATTHVELRRLAPRLPADGLLQRFLLVLARPRALPDTAMLRIDTRHPTEAWDAALRRLYAIEPCVVHLSGGAREIFQAEQSALHDLTQAYEDLLPPLAAHVAKRPAMLARLALTFHALQAVDVTREVSAESMTLAARFLRRQERHALAIYSSTLGANDTGIALARDIARSILASRLQSFNRRDLTPACKAFRNADEPIRQAALTHLHDAGWITADAPSIAHGARWNVDVRVHDLYAEHGEAARKRRETVRARILDDASND